MSSLERRSGAVLDEQRRYYAAARSLARIAPTDTPYVRRHLEAALELAELPAAGGRVLEIGCGLGRFTRLLAGRGHRTTGLDLSPELIAALRADDPGDTIATVVGDAHDVRSLAPGPFDAVFGFFVLHHLVDLERLFRALAHVVAPGGRVVFVEPNAWNPLYYLQITFAPGMSWRGDGGVVRMRRAPLERALAAAGLEPAAHRLYGLLPPLLANRAGAARFERMLERPLRPFAAFRALAAIRR